LLGFGCMRLPQIGKDPSGIDEAAATDMLRAAIDGGVGYVDTAWPYHGTDRLKGGASELLVGRALKDGYRERVMLATKLPTWAVKNRSDMERILNAQLERLQTDHIDCYLAHNLNAGTWPVMREAGLFDFLEAAKADGRIRHIGFSFHERYLLFEEIVTAYDWEFVLLQHNYLDTDYQAGRRGLALAAERGLGIAIMETFRGGFLINCMPEDLQTILRAVRPGWSLSDWGLRWLWDQPSIHVVLSGMSAPDQLDDNMRIAGSCRGGDLTGEDQEALDKVREHFLARIRVHCTGCGYCLPCPAGVNIPKCFMHYNDYGLMDHDEPRARARFFYTNQLRAEAKAVNCTHCGSCEAKCPQNLPISDIMEDVAATFA
jgi:predicted aldo/keto reductase-like oxidoreductase